MLSASSKKLVLRKRLWILIAFIFASSFGFSQSCKAELKVDKDRNVRSADQEGTEFTLTLVNLSSRTETYTISTVNLKESCATSHYKTTTPNVNLAVSVVETRNSLSALKKISLGAGQRKDFKVMVQVPNNTSLNSWSCIEVQAKSEACNTITSSTMLRVFVPDSSEE